MVVLMPATPSLMTGRIRLGNRQRTYFSVLTFSHSTGPGYQAVTWPQLLCPDRPEMTGYCILVKWYTIDEKYRCFLRVTFMFLAWIMHFNFLWCCRGGNKILYQLLKILRLFPSLNLGWACGTVYPHSGAFWSTGGLGTTLGIWKWRPKVSTKSRTLFGLVYFYFKRVLQRKMCHEFIFLWHTFLSH